MKRRRFAQAGASLALGSAAAIVLAGSSVAYGGSTAPLGPAPPACTINYYPGSNCLVQTRLGTFHLSTTVARPGQLVTGTISPGCVIGYGNNAPCPVSWTVDGLTTLGRVVSGCKTHDYTCSVRVPENARGTKGYVVVFVGITNAQGTGYSSDYTAVIGKGPAVIEGRLLDKQDVGLSGVRVDLQGSSGDYVTQTSAGGSYAVEVKPGSYRVTPRLSNPRPSKFAPQSAERSVEAGGTAHADFSADLPALSVADVSAGSAPLAVDVQVAFDDVATDASGCDPNASYSFRDAALASAVSLGRCHYRLTFAAPGSGIYHVVLTATSQAGEQVTASTDQSGNTIDGQFPVIIDSCSRPTQAIPDVAALNNANDPSCDVAVGSWDADAPDLAQQVLSDSLRVPSLELTPTAVEMVDPTDWSKRDLIIVARPDTGWLPTGDNEPTGDLPTGNGDAVALAHRVYPVQSLPKDWDGEDSKLTAAELQAAPPATVISAHGAWYTPNGLIRVPTGDEITMFVPIGATMGGQLGVHVDTGHIVGTDNMYMHTYTAGQLMPNFTFIHYGGADEPQGAHVVSPANPTTLEAVVRPGEGAVWLGSCASVFAPAGQSAAQALTDLPIHAPGTGTVTGSAAASIDAHGVLHAG